MRIRPPITAAAIAVLLPLAACATPQASGYSNAAVGYGASGAVAATAPQDDGLLAEPPADAKAGECFAKVVVPGQPVYGPPSGPHVRWVQTPPQPGTIGPVWCQVWEAGYQPTVTMTPERYGWIRVICDKDATKDKISHVQRRLHDWGVYQGGYDGHYDAETAEAVKRFQAERHIEHGGYLSYRTMEALETRPVVAPPPQMAAPPMTYAYASPCGPQPCAPAYAPPPVVYAPPPMAYAPPCGPQPCAAPPPCGPQPCQGGYNQPAGGQSQGSNTRYYSVQSGRRF